MLTASKARYPSYQGSMMATYFQGGSEIQAAAAGDNLQTLYLMNPNYIPTAAYNSESHAPHHTQTPPNMLLLNPGHAPPPHHQQFIGIPLGCGPHSDSLWSPTADHSPGSQAHRGLSLSLSPDHNRRGRQSTVTVAARNEVQVQGVISGSKYLKAAQELLEEVVNVGSIGKIYRGGGDDGDDADQLSGAHKEKAKVGGGGAGESTSGGGGKRAAEHQLTAAQRQELQMKKSKLLSMLEEVEQRYRQYQTQMQVVMSSFEQAAGVGSAKLYTSVALKTISKQFRCLKDAIGSQIKATSKSLGEEDDHNGGTGKPEGGAGSRLRFVDHQLRQQQALHQLGMMQPNAWRPQRGLPERAVSVLRAWLFEHFLHPYPKDSDKHMLAKQTGLTRSQVSNWFINARVRLWKPMVEEMYTEEMKTQEQNGGSQANTKTASTNNNDTPSKNDHNKDQSMSKATLIARQQHQQQQQDHGGCLIQINHHQQADHHHHQTTTTNDMISNLSAMSTTSPQGFTLIGGNSSSGMESFMTRSSPKKQRSNSDLQNSPSSILSMDMEIKPVDHHHHGDANAGFNPYIVNEINIAGRFNPGQVLTPHQYHGNGAVSLTLGLPPCDNLASIGAGEADFCGISMGQPPSHNPSSGFESIDIQTRKRFAAQLLHDFVA